MPYYDAKPVSANLVTLTYVIYCLHLFSAITGVMTSAAVVTAFLTGWPSIIAVLLNYIKRGAVRGTYLESHFRWQIRTFWFSLLWVVVAAVLFITVIGIPVAWVLVFLLGIWVIYRMARGLLRLNDNRPIEMA